MYIPIISQNGFWAKPANLSAQHTHLFNAQSSSGIAVGLEPMNAFVAFCLAFLIDSLAAWPRQWFIVSKKWWTYKGLLVVINLRPAYIFTKKSGTRLHLDNGTVGGSQGAPEKLGTWRVGKPIALNLPVGISRFFFSNKNCLIKMSNPIWEKHIDAVRRRMWVCDFADSIPIYIMVLCFVFHTLISTVGLLMPDIWFHQGLLEDYEQEINMYGAPTPFLCWMVLWWATK